MMTLFLIVGLSVLVYILLYIKFRALVPARPIDKFTWKLIPLCLLMGLPLLIVSILVIVPLEYVREKRVIDWRRSNGINYQYMIGNREYPRVMRISYRKIYTSDDRGPVRVRIGNMFWGLLSNDIERM